MSPLTPRHLGGWLLAAMACGPAGGAGLSARGEPTAAPVAFRALVLQREDPLSGSRRLALDAPSRLLVRQDKRLREGCEQHWDRRCWDETEWRRTLTPGEMAQVVQALAQVRTSTRPVMASVGESSLQLVLDPGEAGQRRALSTSRDPDASIERLESILIDAVRVR